MKQSVNGKCNVFYAAQRNMLMEKFWLNATAEDLEELLINHFDWIVRENIAKMSIGKSTTRTTYLDQFT